MDFVKPTLLALVCSLVLLALLSSTSAKPVESSSETELQWSEFLEVFGHSYSSQEEADRRYQVFLDNLGAMQEIQSLNPDAEFGVTDFFDLTVDEFVQQYASNMTSDEARYQLEEMNVTVADKPVTADMEDDDEYPVDALPERFDWREKGNYVTAVKNQGQCGSCWAFAANELLESAWAIKTKSLLTLSPQMVLDCSGAGSCGGGYITGALQWFKTNKVTETKNYAYTARDGFCQFDNTNVPAKTGKLTSFSQVAASNGPANMKQAIMSTSPAVFGIWGDMRVLQYYQGGVIADCGTEENGGHAMVVTGWMVYNGKPCWRVRNSWGTGFGRNGYMLFDNTQNACGINNYAFVAKA